jgi:energy-coupling factor transporter transmembrane protein EcfT
MNNYSYFRYITGDSKIHKMNSKMKIIWILLTTLLILSSTKIDSSDFRLTSCILYPFLKTKGYGYHSLLVDSRFFPFLIRTTPMYISLPPTEGTAWLFITHQGKAYWSITFLLQVNCTLFKNQCQAFLFNQTQHTHLRYIL